MTREEREAHFARLLYRWWLDEQPAWTERGWWDAALREDVRALLWLPAGPLLAGALAALDRPRICPEPHDGESPPGQLPPGHAPGSPCACQVVVAAAWQACAGWAAARSTEALIDAAGKGPVVVSVPATGQRITDPAREELAAALRMSPGSMSNRIAAARELIAHPRLLAQVLSAAMSPWAARLVVLELADLTTKQSEAVVEQVCTKLESRQARGSRSWTSAEVGRAARMARRRLCPDTDHQAREKAFQRRRVLVLSDKNGMATLVADLDDTHAYRIHRRLSAITRGLSDVGESRTHDQIRADVFVDLLLGTPAPEAGEGAAHLPTDGAGPEVRTPSAAAALAAGTALTGAADTSRAPVVDSVSSPNGRLPRAEIQVVVAWETLMAMSAEPGSIPGFGPISPDVARELAADGRWRAWITDSCGTVIATSSTTYTPNARLARLVRARERYCRMPGCRHPAESCDLDHALPYPRGATSAANLGPLCRRHHNLKTHLGWQMEPTERPAGPESPPPPGPESPPPPAPPPRSGTAPPAGPPAWRWRTPSGFTITDHVDHPLE